MPLFGKSQKSPQELVKALKEAVNSLERGDKKAEKAQEDVSKNLVSRFTQLVLSHYHVHAYGIHVIHTYIDRMHHFVASSDFRCVWCCTFLFDNRTIFARSISKQQPLAHNGLCYLSLDSWNYEVGSFEELCRANACCFDIFSCLFKYVHLVEDHWRTLFPPLTVGQYHWILNSTA